MRPTAVNAILSEVRALQTQGHSLVSLMRGEPDFATPPHIVAAAARAAGMIAMAADGFEKCKEGLTTMEEVARVAIEE